MAEIVNLRRLRKAAARRQSAAAAAQNRIDFGRSKVERQAESAAQALETRKLDGHRLGAQDGMPGLEE